MKVLQNSWYRFILAAFAIAAMAAAAGAPGAWPD